MPPVNSRRTTTIKLFTLIMSACYYFYLTGLAAILYAQPLYWKQDYHTSALTGEMWVQELMYGHPDRIYCELGMRLHVFTTFVAELRRFGAEDSRWVTLEEQVAIFLYTCVTGYQYDM